MNALLSRVYSVSDLPNRNPSLRMAEPVVRVRNPKSSN
jgi:hypothetical protein